MAAWGDKEALKSTELSGWGNIQAQLEICSMVPARHGSSTAWFQHGMVPAQHGSSTAWFQHGMVPAWHGSSTAWLLPCYQHSMLPALHRIAEIACQENHIMCKDTISLLVKLLFIGRNYLKSTNSWCRATLAFRTILNSISLKVNLKVKVTSIASYVVLGSDMTYVVVCNQPYIPGLLQLQFLITCCMQIKAEGEGHHVQCQDTQEAVATEES